MNWRSLVSFTLAWMFIVLVVSGVVLYIAPPGRVAHWTDWTLMGLMKEQWQGLHTLASVLFVVGGLFHLLDLNRRAIWNYLKRGRNAGSHFRTSLVVSTLVSAAFVAGTIAGVPPFSWVVDLGERATESWETAQSAAPAPHAEEWTLREAVERLGLENGAGKPALEAAGIRVEDPDQTLRDVADRNGMTPEAVYAVLVQAGPNDASGSAAPQTAPAGLGRMPLTAVAESAGLELDVVLRRLQEAGIQASGTDTLRNLADAAGVSPKDLWDTVTGAQGDDD